MLRQVQQLYRASLKPRDNFWTEVMTRPVAAFLLVFLHRTPLTPNQVTFLSLFTALGAAAVLCGWLTWPGLLVGALLLQASYVLDAVDGQLARLRGIASPLGHQLDFLMDEIKAFVILAAVTTRLFLIHGSVEILLLGLWGLVVVASGISITTFIRRPEYESAMAPRASSGSVGEGPAAPLPLSRRLVRLAGQGGLRFARFLIHYPSYFFYLAVFDRLEWYFYVYICVHTLYLARSFLGILLRLGQPGFPARPAAEPARDPR